MVPRDLLMPVSGKISAISKDWASYYDHDYEVCKPYSYSVWLEDPDIKLEVVPGEKTSFYQIAWNKKEPKHLMLAVTTSGEMKIAGNNTVEGYEVYSENVKVFFCIKTSKSFVSDSSWNAGTITAEGVQFR